MRYGGANHFSPKPGSIIESKPYNEKCPFVPFFASFPHGSQTFFINMENWRQILYAFPGLLNLESLRFPTG